MKCSTRPYNPCPTTPNAKCVIYTGPNLTNINVNINDRLDVIIQNINNAFNDLEFDLITEDTVTLDLSGDGTTQHPLFGDVNVSAFPQNAISIRPDGLYAPLTIEAGVVYGGIVTWISDYNYHVTAAGYYINGQFYESPEADFTLTSPDPDFNRVDTFIVDVTGAAGVLEGTPAVDPAQAPLDPATQLFLSFAIVETGTTEPTLTTECLYRNNAEWATVTSNVAKLNPDSTTDPCNGVKAIEGTSVVNNDNILLAKGSSFTPATDFTVLTFKIKSKGSWGSTRRLRFQWELAGVPVGDPVDLFQGQYSFISTNTGSCQNISIPISHFGLLSTENVDSLRIKGFNITTLSIGFQLDDICMQDVPIANTPSSPDEKVKVSANDAIAGYLNGKLVAGTGITLTENNDGGNETLTITAAAGLTFDNGLTKTLNNVQLGGELLHNTTIDTTTAYSLIVSGDVSLATDNGTLQSINNSVTGNAVYAQAGAGAAFYGSTTGGTAVNGIDNSFGIGIRGQTISGTGVVGTSTTGIGGDFYTNPASTGTVARVANFQRLSSGTAVDGIGGSLGLFVATDSGGATEATQLISRWTTAANATRTSQFEVAQYNSAALETHFTLKGTGQLQLNNYDGAVATFTGTPTFNLAIDTNGNVIQSALPAALAANNGLSLSGSTVQLGGNPLIQETTISTSAFGLTLNSSKVGTAFQVVNSSTSGVGIVGVTSGNNSLAYGVAGSSVGGPGVYGVSTSYYGVVAESPAGGIFATSSGGYGLLVSSQTTTNNAVRHSILMTSSVSGGGQPAIGFGTGIFIQLDKAVGAGNLQASTYQVRYTDISGGTENVEVAIQTTQNGAGMNDRLVIKGLDGSLTAPSYGSGIVTGGVATYGAAFDSTGKLIEVALGGAGFTNPMGAIGDIITSSDGAGTPVAISPGAAGTVLTSNGVGSQPTWQVLAGSGTVTSVAVSGSDFSITGSPITGSGTIGLTLATVNSNTGSFGSSTAIPTFTVNAKGLITAASTAAVVAPAGSLTGTTMAANVVTSSLTSVGTITSGTWNGTAVAATFGGTGQTTWTTGQLLYASASNTLSKLSIGSSGQVLTVSGGLPVWASLAGSGTVTSVGVSGGTTGLVTSGGPITGSGTITLSGTLIAANGGTGQTSYTVGDILYASTTTALSKLAGVATGNALISGGVGAAPSWGKINLTTHVTGDLPYSNLAQGLGLSVLGVSGTSTADNASLTAGSDHNVLRRSGSTLAFGTINLAQPGAVGSSVLLPINGGTGQSTYTNGQLLIGNTTGNTLTKATLTAGQGIQITNGTGSITIASSFNPARVTLTDASTIVWNINNGEAAVVTLGNINRTLSITNPVAGRTYVLEIIQDGTGNRTISTWPTGTTWVGGIPPTLSTVAGQVDVVSFYYNGTNYRGVFNGPFA